MGLARFLGTTRGKIERAIAELEDHGVFDRTEEGIIFCRRMVREVGEKKAKKSYSQAQNVLNEDEKNQGKPPKTRARASAPRSRATQGPKGLKDSTSLDKPETYAAAREDEKISEGNPLSAAARRLDRADARPVLPEERPPPKSPALKAKIEQQQRTKHVRFLNRTCPAGFGAAYLTIQQSGDADEAKRLFEAVDSRMRREHWNDMRQWRADAKVDSAQRKRPPPISLVQQELGFATLKSIAYDFAAPLPQMPLDTWRRGAA
jgi:hypothetical protein